MTASLGCALAGRTGPIPEVHTAMISGSPEPLKLTMSQQASCYEGHVDSLHPEDGKAGRAPFPQVFTTTQASPVSPQGPGESSPLSAVSCWWLVPKALANSRKLCETGSIRPIQMALGALARVVQLEGSTMVVT